MRRALTSLTLALLASCGAPETTPDAETDACGPSEGTVATVIDGDTLRLASGETIRLLLVDTSETYGDVECWGDEAKAATRGLLTGKHVRLEYDVECRDRYDRLLAYVERDGFDVNAYLVESGHACVLQVKPNGAERVDAMRELERQARAEGRGLWGACTERVC